MKVYFSCTTAEFRRYRKSYFAIRDYLVDQGLVLTRDWLANAEWRISSGNVDLRDVRQIYRESVAAIKEADVVIMEDTVSNFSTGHQITLALRLRKPTLVLWRQQKRHEFNRMFIHGIESDILQISEYTDENLDSTLRAFIAKFQAGHEDNRFNLVLSGVERNYLDWMHHQTGKSRTQVIREAVRTALVNDADYAAYLGRTPSSS